MTPLGRGRSGVADGYSHGWDQRHLHPGNAHVLKRPEWVCWGRLRLLAVMRSVDLRAQHDWAIEWRRITCGVGRGRCLPILYARTLSLRTIKRADECIPILVWSVYFATDGTTLRETCSYPEEVNRGYCLPGRRFGTQAMPTKTTGSTMRWFQSAENHVLRQQ